MATFSAQPLTAKAKVPLSSTAVVSEATAVAQAKVEPAIVAMRAGMAAADQARTLAALHGSHPLRDMVAQAAKAPAVSTIKAASKTDPTLPQVFAQFRGDMRRAGLVPYECTDSMLGVAYNGPAVNVKNPNMVTAATSLLLVTHSIGRGVYRIYPVLTPLQLSPAKTAG